MPPLKVRKVGARKHERAVGIVVMLLATFAHHPGAAQQKTERMRVTSASNVRVRVEPSIEVKILATLPLASDLIELARSGDGQWIRVRTPGGLEGWVSSPLTRSVPPGARDQVLQEIVIGRAAQGGFGFHAATELIAAIDDLLKRVTEPEKASRLTLARLQGFADAARSGAHRYRPTDPAIAAWYDRHGSLLVYSDPAASWMLRRDAILAEHDRHRGTAAAEQMAWLAVTNDLPGECEGDVPCYVHRHDLLDGEYLRRYANGTFVDTALRQILDRATWWQQLMADSRLFTMADCGRLKAPLASLRAAVAAAKQSGEAGLQDQTLGALDRVAQVCVGPDVRTPNFELSTSGSIYP